MDSLQRFFDAPVDYSAMFTERVEVISKALSEALGVDVYHDSNMDYNAGQSLALYLLPDGSLTSHLFCEVC